MNSILDKKLVKKSSYIGGCWSNENKSFQVHNPATGDLLEDLSDAKISDANKAISEAEKALLAWSNQSAYERCEKLNNWYNLIVQNKDDLALILSLEQGKPLSEALAEISYGASYIQWFSQEALRIYGDTIPSNSPEKSIITIKQAVGVVSAITPWNFPHAMITRKAAAALAAGCTFVVKPALQTPLSALALAELADRVGIPAGVFNVVVSSQTEDVGRVLTNHPAVRKFTFTGSTEVGKKLISQCASTVKKVSMELGGNAPFIVFDDADLPQAVAGALSAKHRNAGQTCIAANRFYIHRKIYDQFLLMYLEGVKKLSIGQGNLKDTDIGPLISKAAVAKVTELVDISVKQGATLLYQASLNLSPELIESHFYPPTVLTNVTQNMPIFKNEIFGPVSAFTIFDNESEVISLANDTPYGLAGYFYTQNIKRVWRVAKALECGMLGINDCNISNASAPFGGIKASGYGREGSKYGLEDYLEVKYLSLGYK